MPLPSPGSAISLSQVNVELARASTATISMNDANLRALFGVPSPSSTISMSQGWGKSFLPKAGFFAGGANTSSFPFPNNNTSNIETMSFTTETTSPIAATLAVGRQQALGYSPVSGSIGYFGGGTQSVASFINQVDGLNMSTFAALNPGATVVRRPVPPAPPSSAVYGDLRDNMTNGGSTGYALSLSTPPLGPLQNHNKCNFPTATFSLMGALLTPTPTPANPFYMTSRFFVSNFTNMWSLGGPIGPPTASGRPMQAYVQRYSFSTETDTFLGSTLHRRMARVNGYHNFDAPTAGYMTIGNKIPESSTPPYIPSGIVDKWVFSTETGVQLGATIPNASNPATLPSGSVGRQNYFVVESTTKGYMAGGSFGPTGTYRNNIDAFRFDTETFQANASALAGRKQQGATIRSK